MTNEKNQLKPVPTKFIGIIFLVILILFGLTKMLIKIPAGYAGVVYSLNGGIQEKVLTQGLKFVTPWKKVTKYSVATEQAYLSADSREGSEHNESFLIPTADGKVVNVDLEFSYRYDIERLPAIFNRFRGQDGKTVEQTFIRGKVKAWVSEVSSKYSVIDLYGNKRAELNADAFNQLKAKFDPYGILIESVNFSRIEPDEQTKLAIQEKINAQQKLEQAKIERQKAEILAQKLVIEAEGKAKAKVKEAEGIAKSNKLITESLTPALIQYQKTLKWDGVLPKATNGNTFLKLD